jgi:predicted transcriptional regulator
MTTIELKLNMPDDLLATLQRAAESRDMPLDAMVVDLLKDYFDEPTDEEILQGIREGMHDALTGNTRPAREFLDELDREDDANAS